MNKFVQTVLYAVIASFLLGALIPDVITAALSYVGLSAIPAGQAVAAISLVTIGLIGFGRWVSKKLKSKDGGKDA